MASRFGDWYRKQFGPRPSKLTINELREAVDAQKEALWKAETLLYFTQLYDDQKTAALYAWNARGTVDGDDKGPIREVVSTRVRKASK